MPAEKWEQFLGKTKEQRLNIDRVLASRGNHPKLLETSAPILLTVGEKTQLLISSSDVIHAFSIPRLGLKVDAVPGRINQLFVRPLQQGVYYGQCSEICGSAHSFIPINVWVTPSENPKSN